MKLVNTLFIKYKGLNTKSIYLQLFEELDPEVKREIVKICSSQTIQTSEICLEQFEDEQYNLMKVVNSENYANSLRASFKHLKEYFGKSKVVSTITNEEAQLFLIWLLGRVPKGWRVYYRNYKAAFNRAVDLGIIEKNPFYKLKVPKKQRTIPPIATLMEVEAIVEKIPNPALKRMILTAFYTGARRGELLNLRWGNVDFANRTIIIGDEVFQTKTRQQRIIPICDRLYAILQEQYIEVADISEYVFCKGNGFRFSKDHITHAFKEAVLEAGLNPALHFHSLRHSFASFLVQNKASLYTVKELLGHSSITTTEIYSHLNMASLHNSISLFNDMSVEGIV